MDPAVISASIAAVASVAGVVLVIWHGRASDRAREVAAAIVAERQRENALALAAVERSVIQVAVNVNGHLSGLLKELGELRARAEHAEGRREGIEAAVVETAARALVLDPTATVARVLPLGPAPTPVDEPKEPA